MIRRLSLSALLAVLPAAGLAQDVQSEPVRPPPSGASAAEGEPAPKDAAAAPSASAAPATAPAKAKPDPSIDQHKLSLEEINERMIGSASQAVRFNWRRTTVGVGITSSSLLELNNFGSSRWGVVARRPVFGGMLGEIAVTRVSTWSTPSSHLLSLTPYRQAGRPSRWELDVNLSFPLAEGVVTAWPSWFPATQLVFSATAGARYLFYPGSVDGMPLLDASARLISPLLNDAELINLEDDRNGGMAIDRARYGLLAGLSMDLYFKQGFFFTPRALINLPVLSGIGSNGVGFWWELTFAGGWAF